MKTIRQKKVTMMALAVLMFGLPMGLRAQHDSFFNNYGNGVRLDPTVNVGFNNLGFGFTGSNITNGGFGWTGSDITNGGFGETGGGITNDSFTTPLGGGTAILVASAAGYALLKRRKSSNPKTPNNLKHLKHLKHLNS